MTLFNSYLCPYIKNIVIKRGIFLLFLCGCISAFAADLKFTGNALPVLEEMPDKSTGLDKIYVCYTTDNLRFSYSSSNPSRVKVFRYSNLGGGFAEEVRNLSYSYDEITVNNIEGNSGYIIEENDKRYYYWIVNYLPYRLKLNSVGLAPEVDCDATLLNVSGEGAAIYYFTITGVQKVLSREITVSFTTQELDEASGSFNQVDTKKYFDYLSPTLRIVPPAYCSTYFEVEGDKFLKQWHWEEKIESEVFSPVAVSSITKVEQENASNKSDSSSRVDEEDDSTDYTSMADSSGDSEEEGSNVISSGDETSLGGSAPAHIFFSATTTEGVLHNEWQYSRNPEFTNPEYRFYVKDLDYTFNDEGTFYLRYIGSNADGSCETISDTYTVTIGASELLCPNAFTPDGDGINDKWKVAYRSLLEFKCWIFDRYGAQIFYFDDPNEGWDGKHHGKLVKSGVYYYVIQAQGADGVKYKKSGDINIIRHKYNSESGN